MNFRGYAGYVDYLNKLEKNCKALASVEDTEDDKSNYYSNANSSEENENQGSNMFEILEKINSDLKYSFQFSEHTSTSKKQDFYHLELFSLLKVSLSTPPPELI